MKTAAEQIRSEITEDGAISFARFMTLALYCPDCGYYEKEKDRLGQRGDFYTSVSVGSLFGELLAFQFAEWLGKLRIAHCGLQIVEAGAHDGRLANDILSWLEAHRPGLFANLEYWILEPSARRQQWQRELLQQFGAKIRWLADLDDIAPRTISGVVFSNELLDAMPVDRIGWDSSSRQWFTWGVTCQGDRFVWTRMLNTVNTPQSEVLVLPRNEKLLAALPDGFTLESSGAAVKWWWQAAERLKSGRLLTLDYGLDSEDFWSPQRVSGTLRAYHRHRLVDDVLANPGEQDLTAHINFTSLKAAGERAGLKTGTDCSQTQFLTGIGQLAWKEGSAFGRWTSEHTRQFQTLTHPEHLGRAFRVLVQSAERG